MTRKAQWKFTLPLALAIGITGGPSAPADIIDGTRPDVIIDQSVLDQLGPPSNLPGLLLQQPAPGTAKIGLIPPHGRKPGARRHRVMETAPAARTEPAAVHLHPIRPHAPRSDEPPAAKLHEAAAAPGTARVKTPAPAKSADPISLTPTPAPADGGSVTTEPLKAPASSKPPILSIAPAPAVPQTVASPAAAPAPPPLAGPSPAPANGAATPLMALTAQPANTEAPSPPPRDSVDSIEFDRESARLPESAKDILTHLASRMGEDATLDVQLVAYASGDEENASKARKLSLSRAVAVRSFLIDQGVRTTRIDVRALGNKVPDGRPDRVDLVVQKRG